MVYKRICLSHYSRTGNNGIIWGEGGNGHTDSPRVDWPPAGSGKRWQIGFVVNEQDREVSVPIEVRLDYNGIDPKALQNCTKDGCGPSSVMGSIGKSLFYQCTRKDKINPQTILDALYSNNLFTGEKQFPLDKKYHTEIRAGRLQDGRWFTRPLKGEEMPDNVDRIFAFVRISKMENPETR
jgi:hypothetical protein